MREKTVFLVIVAVSIAIALAGCGWLLWPAQQQYQYPVTLFRALYQALDNTILGVALGGDSKIVAIRHLESEVVAIYHHKKRWCSDGPCEDMEVFYLHETGRLIKWHQESNCFPDREKQGSSIYFIGQPNFDFEVGDNDAVFAARQASDTDRQVLGERLLAYVKILNKQHCFF